MTSSMMTFPIVFVCTHRSRCLHRIYHSLNEVWTLNQIGQIGVNMMMSSNGNLLRVTGPLCGEFTGHLKTLASKLFVQFIIAFSNKRNINSPNNRPSQKAHYAESVSDSWRHHSDLVSEDLEEKLPVAPFLFRIICDSFHGLQLLLQCVAPKIKITPCHSYCLPRPRFNII